MSLDASRARLNGRRTATNGGGGAAKSARAPRAGRRLRPGHARGRGQGIHFVIVTGLSGAGKSTALRVFEDLEFFCVDNLPPALLPKFADLCLHSDGRVRRVALGIDIRGGEFFNELLAAVEDVEARGLRAEILFLDASDDVLVRRFKETRRKHPLSQTGGVLVGIRAERRRLETAKGRAHRVIDTSTLTAKELREEITSMYGHDRPPSKRLEVNVVTFGFKYGIPLDADLVLDVRFLPNPYYEPTLRPLPGSHGRVRKYVLDQPATHGFLTHMFAFTDYLLPQFVHEGKRQLTIAIGCTGGRHRSVVLGDVLTRHLRGLGYRARVRHRDLRRDDRKGEAE